MVEIYSGGRKKQYKNQRQIRKMIKKMMKSYKYVPYYKNKTEQDHQEAESDAEELLVKLNDINML